MNEEQVTREQAEQVLAALQRQCAGWIGEETQYGPTLAEDFDGRPFVIIWEEGPDGWPFAFPHGLAEDCGGRIADVSADVPPGLLVEPINHYSVGIYRV